MLSIREGERKSASKRRGFWTRIGRGKSSMGRASSFSESTYLYHSHSNGHWPDWRFDLGIFMEGDLYVVKIGARVIHQPLMIARRKESSGTSCNSESSTVPNRKKKGAWACSSSSLDRAPYYVWELWWRWGLQKATFSDIDKDRGHCHWWKQR